MDQCSKQLSQGCSHFLLTDFILNEKAGVLGLGSTQLLSYDMDIGKFFALSEPQFSHTHIRENNPSPCLLISQAAAWIQPEQRCQALGEFRVVEPATVPQGTLVVPEIIDPSLPFLVPRPYT